MDCSTVLCGEYSFNQVKFHSSFTELQGILEQKTGPVQNSPPEKVLSEPGPWSPVYDSTTFIICD